LLKVIQIGWGRTAKTGGQEKEADQDSKVLTGFSTAADAPIRV
jgi:hypothetical protein